MDRKPSTLHKPEIRGGFCGGGVCGWPARPKSARQDHPRTRMKRAICGTLVATQLMTCGFAFAQTNTHSPSRTNQGLGASPPSPVLAVSPSALNFGLVGVGRTKQLTFTVQNVGSGLLKGTATVALPYDLSGNAYWLQNGQSQSISVRYLPTAEGTNSESVVFSGGNPATVTLTGCARRPPRAPGKPRVISQAAMQFTEEEQADFIVRYYTDQTSYLLKPALREGAFQSICDRALALRVAAQQPRRELAVAVLIHYTAAAIEESVKAAWVKDLAALGYQRVVFLRAQNQITRVNRLTVLEGPQ